MGVAHDHSLFENYFKATALFAHLKQEYPELEIFEMNSGRYEINEVQNAFIAFVSEEGESDYVERNS